ncbi:hypothetical protein [Terrimonas pollutisoli]|uniref:hypothetical protein n=1 Tax=Terrimonas pollutisoli TaxID=3034147 RepID=UPI0023EB550C|nr:hypothetical protein [Terrimonas sp. H1YJ31]
MKTTTSPGYVPPSSTETRLYDIAEALLNSVLSTAASNGKSFTNDIPRHLTLGDGLHSVTFVLSAVLTALVRHAEYDCVHLSANVSELMALVHIRNIGLLNVVTFEQDMSKWQPLVEKMPGSVSVAVGQNNMATITFGFPQKPL